MKIFSLTLSQMLMIFTLILVGFVLRKMKILPESSDSTLSKLETFIFVPALSIYNQMINCNVQTFRENFSLMFYGLALVMIALLLSYPLSGLFVKNPDSSPEAYYQRNIYKYAMTFGNYGFMGNFIILGIWGGEGLFKYQMLTFFIGIVCHSWGIYILIPKESGNRSIWQNLLKAVKTPPVVALILGIMLGLINAQQYCPDFVMNALSNTSKCMGPVAMLLAGFVIGGYEFKSLFSIKKVYVASFLRLIVIPAFMAVILKLLNVNEEIITLALIAFATPLGLNTIVFPATYGGDTKTGASMAMVSHALSVLTLPLMYYLFIVLI